MKNAYASKLRVTKAQETLWTFNGYQLACCNTLIALENVLTDILDEETMRRILPDIESDMQRIFDEEMEKSKGNPRDMSDIISYNVDKIREKYGMNPIDWENPWGGVK